MEALILLLFIVNNLVWMFFLYIFTPHKPTRSIKVPTPREIMREIMPKKSKKPPVTVDLMNVSEDDISDMTKAISEGLANGQ